MKDTLHRSTLFLKLVLPGWPGKQRSSQMVLYDTGNFLASNVLASSGARKPSMALQGKWGRRVLAGAQPCLQTLRTLLCVCLLPCGSCSTIPIPQGGENSSLSVYSMKCYPWCSKCLRAQSTQFKTIKRYKTENW